MAEREIPIQTATNRLLITLTQRFGETGTNGTGKRYVRLEHAL